MPLSYTTRLPNEVKEELEALFELHEETRLQILIRLSQLPAGFDCRSYPWLANMQIIGGPAVSVIGGKPDP